MGPPPCGYTSGCTIRTAWNSVISADSAEMCSPATRGVHMDGSADLKVSLTRPFCALTPTSSQNDPLWHADTQPRGPPLPGEGGVCFPWLGTSASHFWVILAVGRVVGGSPYPPLTSPPWGHTLAPWLTVPGGACLARNRMSATEQTCSGRCGTSSRQS